MSACVMPAMRAPRLGSSSTSPSDASRASASRTGVRETPSSRESPSWCSRACSSSWPARMRSRRIAYTWSAAEATLTLGEAIASRTVASHRLHPYGHALDAGEEVGAQALDRSRQLDGGHARQQLLKGDLDLQAGQVGAKAEVHPAGPEGHVRVGLAADVEDVGAVEDLLVAIARGEPRRHLVPAADLLAGELHVARRRPAEVGHRRGPAQNLLRGDRHQRRLAAQPVE